MSLGLAEDISVLHSNFTNSCSILSTYAVNGQAMYLSKVEKDGIIFDKNMRDLVVEYSFLKLFLSWEFFLEQVFISYSLGYKGINGKKLNSYVSPKDYDHAYSIIQGDKQYPDWTSAEKVLKLANDFFENGGTFNKLGNIRSTLQDIKTIRNALSHMSINAQNKFESLVRNHKGHYPNGTTAADFLLMIDTKNSSNITTFFNLYVVTLKSFSIEIVTPN